MLERYHYLQFLLSCFYRNQSVFTESFDEEEFLWNTCTTFFGLDDIDIDANDFYNWAKKEEENCTISFYFCQLTIMKDHSPA